MKKNDVLAAWQGLANCKGCGIRDMALFADLRREDFTLIHLPIDELRYAAGAPLYHIGDAPDAVFTIRSGLIKLEQYSAGGGRRIVRLLRPGDTAGLEAVLQQPYAHTAVALRPALTCRIPIAVIDRLSQETPRLQKQLMQRWSQAVERADAFLVELGTGSARARVARLFITLVDDDPDSCCDLFGREDVGAMLGVTTETASRTVAEFKRQKLVEELSPNRFRCDLDGLEDAAAEV